ncbi:hypothetical protein [Microcoleus sp. MON2_D5]
MAGTAEGWQNRTTGTAEGWQNRTTGTAEAMGEAGTAGTVRETSTV